MVSLFEIFKSLFGKKEKVPREIKELEKLEKEILGKKKREVEKRRKKSVKTKKRLGKKVKVKEKRPKKREKIRESTVEEIMTRHVIKVKPDDNLSYVVQLLAEKNISGLPVVEGNKFVGVISESDIIRVVGSKSLLELDTLGLKKLRDIKVREAMNKKPIAIYVKSKVSKAADLMNKYDISRLPVINERGELVGIVTKKDIIKGISKDFLVRVIKEPEKLGVEFIETELDEILKIVEREGSVSIDEIKKRVEIPEEKIEEWGRILEKHNLIEVYYPPVGKPIFKKKEVKLK